MRRDLERVSSDDLMSLATDRGTVPMQVGAVLILDTTAGFDPAALLAQLRGGSRPSPACGNDCCGPGFPFRSTVLDRRSALPDRESFFGCPLPAVGWDGRAHRDGGRPSHHKFLPRPP